MRARVLVIFAAVVLVARTSFAQQDTQTCPAGNTQDACQKAVDLFNYMAPQLGVSITGGNATLGQGGTLGGLGHFTVGVRANAVQGSLPEVNSAGIAIGAAQRGTYDTKSQIMGLPTADLAIGIFKGLPIGISNVGGVDLLVSASYLPEFDGEGVRVRVPNGSLKLGYGVRVGILQESLLTPGVSATYLRRDLPTLDITATAPGPLTGTDSLLITGLSAETNAWRIVASKSLLMFGVAVGAGQDRYVAGADIRADLASRNPLNLNQRTAAAAGRRITQSVTRTNVFADLTVNLLIFKLTGEIGQVSGGTINTFNNFDGKQAADSRAYGSIGVRFGF